MSFVADLESTKQSPNLVQQLLFIFRQRCRICTCRWIGTGWILHPPKKQPMFVEWMRDIQKNSERKQPRRSWSWRNTEKSGRSSASWETCESSCVSIYPSNFWDLDMSMLKCCRHNLNWMLTQHYWRSKSDLDSRSAVSSDHGNESSKRITLSFICLQHHFVIPWLTLFPRYRVHKLKQFSWKLQPSYTGITLAKLSPSQEW